jgi:hypothetical protein
MRWAHVLERHGGGEGGHYLWSSLLECGRKFLGYITVSIQWYGLQMGSRHGATSWGGLGS